MKMSPYKNIGRSIHSGGAPFSFTNMKPAMHGALNGNAKTSSQSGGGRSGPAMVKGSKS